MGKDTQKRPRAYIANPKTGVFAAWYGDREIRVTRGGLTEIIHLEQAPRGPEIWEILDTFTKDTQQPGSLT